MDRTRGGGRLPAIGGTGSGINISAAADPSSISSFAWPQSHSSRAETTRASSSSHPHVPPRRSQPAASLAAAANGLSPSQHTAHQTTQEAPIYTSQKLTASPPASPSSAGRVVPPTSIVTRRRSSRAHDAEPLTVGQTYAAAYAAATAAELEMSKGGHSLRKRARIDYQHMDNGEPTPSSSGEQTGEDTNGDESEVLPAPAPAPTSVSAPVPQSPAVTSPTSSKRGRKRKVVHSAGRGSSGGEAKSPPPPPPALPFKKIRLVHHEAATPSSTVQRSSANGTDASAAGSANGHVSAAGAKIANDVSPSLTARGRGRPLNKKSIVTLKHPGTSSSSQTDAAPSLPGRKALVNDTIKVGGSPSSSDTDEPESLVSATPLHRLASSKLSVPKHKASSVVATTTLSTISAPAPVTRSVKLTGPSSATKNSSAPIANGHSPGKLGRPRRQSTAATPLQEAPRDVAEDSLPLLTSDHGSTSPETLDTAASSQDLSLRRHRLRNHRLMLRIPRGRDRSPPSVHILATSEDEERYAAFMEARAADAKAGATVLPTFEAFDIRRNDLAADSEESVNKPKAAMAASEMDKTVGTADAGRDGSAHVDAAVEEAHNDDRSISPVALRSSARRTSMRIASATVQKEQPVSEAREASLKEQKVATSASARPDRVKPKQSNTCSATKASDSAIATTTATATLFATANGHGRATTATRRASTSHRLWKTLTPFEAESIFLPEQFHDNATAAATASPSAIPNTESADLAGRSGQTEITAHSNAAAPGSETPAPVDLEAVLQQKIAADTRLEEAAAAAAVAVATPDAFVDSAATTPAPATPTDLPAATTVRERATLSAVREPLWKKQFRFQKIRDPKEFVDALQNHKDMSTEDLFACLAHINDSLRAWQDEYRLLRGITDDEENAVRRRQQDATFENRTLMALKRGNVDTEITERDFVVKGIRAPESLADPIKRYARQQDKLQSNVYLFEYDPRDSMIGRQDPVAQRQGLQNTRLRNRPKQTLKAAEAEAADENNDLGAGRRTRRGRKPANAAEDESAEDSRTGTPMPSAPASVAPASSATAPTSNIAPTRGRRGRPPGPAAIAAAAAAAAASAAAVNKTDDDDSQADAAAVPTTAIAQTPTRRGRRGRAPRSLLSESHVKDDEEAEVKETQVSPFALAESSTTPEKKITAAAPAATASPLAPSGPGRKRRRGRKPNSLLRQEALETEAAAAATEATGEVTEEDDDSNETATEMPPQDQVSGRSNNKRPRVMTKDDKRDASDLHAIGPGSFYKHGAASRRSSASSNETAEAAPPPPITKAVDSSYELRPKRRRKFRSVLNGLADDNEDDIQQQHSGNRNKDATDGDDTLTSGPPAKRQRLRQRTAGAVATTINESAAPAPAETASESVAVSDHSNIHLKRTTPARAASTPTPTPSSNNLSNSAAYSHPMGAHEVVSPAYDSYPHQHREHLHHGGTSHYQQLPHQQPPLPPHAAYYGHTMDPYYGHQHQQQQGPPPPPSQHIYGNVYGSHQQQQQQHMSQPLQHQMHQPSPSSAYYGQSQPYHHHQQSPSPRLQQHHHHNNLAPPTNTSGPHPSSLTQPPASGRQRTIFKIKNYTPAPVAPSAGVQAFTQMIHNRGVGGGGSGSDRRGSLNSAPHRQSLPSIGTHSMPSLAHFLPQSPGDLHGSGHMNSGMASVGSPGGMMFSPNGGGGIPGMPGDMNTPGNDKDYRQMTKSEKMSHSMKTRWANGSMQAAVAKRKATLAAKKAAAQQAQHQANSVSLNGGPMSNASVSSHSPIGSHSHPHLSALGEASHIGHGPLGMSGSDGHGGHGGHSGLGAAHHMSEYGYHRPYMAGVPTYDAHSHHYNANPPDSPPLRNGMLYAANNRQDA
ncbi:hypothetical protein SEPCBS119000_000084 [Sporothrix epigloea]|uniref:Uncharacterized protein n=1 Tax=Sporothrix epigloea TaxID=1892477 RepID=A0ABP0D4W7_9PEZI